MWNLTRDSDQNSAQLLLSWTIYGEILTLVQRTQTNRYCTIDQNKKKNLQFMQNVWVLQANHKSASNLWAQSETLLIALSVSPHWPNR